MSKVLQIENLGKSYQIGEYGGIGVQNQNENIDALQNVSFEVNRGEVVGIIGKNGAGKSTLLKLLSQITMPTAGIIRAKGKIASLLEVGTGMHPDLTGRENVFLNGAILGMSKAEIKSKFDEIVRFSGCEAFIDTPIKRYSSGMKVRLGFSVAAFLDSEIIIIDEVLAVGDAEFQSKAIQKILEITADGAKTILFVSHNMASVKSLCNRCLLLEKGKLIYDGDIDKAISRYMGYDTQMSDRNKVWITGSAPGNADYKLRAARIVAKGKTFEEPLSTSDSIAIEVEIESVQKAERLDITFQLMSEAGDFLAATSTFQISDSELKANKEGNMTLFSCLIPANIFNQSTYRINCLLLENRKTVVHRFDDLFKLGFTAAGRNPESWMGQAKSHFLPHLNWNITVK
ncbi:ABC transporter ATP-binding protein [Cryomorpha ignava]|uniref:ABC transporter ATP-binding protein n=1 Tax=Cryomorpha ignava TaxID=101383 RepID=A0A7K3WTS4_9FLAO|nr:ABC transporter ATP-binding protein [Cryomorpha ignava]NEN24065.1 ABC transporter ATP-binding protein [Cryomorpha ignava]